MADAISAAPFMSPSLIRQSLALRQQLSTSTMEQMTGTVVDPARHLNGDLAALTRLDANLARLSGFDRTASEAEVLAEMMQSALGVISTGADSIANRLITTESVQNSQQLAAVAADARQVFNTIISVLNSRISGYAIFGGVSSSSPPLPDDAAILGDLSAALGGITDPVLAQAAITDWFDGSTGFLALYSGGAPRGPVPVASGETVLLDATAMDPGLRQTLSGMAMIALLDEGVFQGDEPARAELARAAARELVSAAEARQLLMARIGVAQEGIARAQARNSAERTALEVTRLAMIEADPYATATRIKDLEARLEAFYLVITRLSLLSLLNFMR